MYHLWHKMVHEYKGNKLQLGLSILPTPTQICYSLLQHIYIILLPTPTYITTLYSLLQPYIYKTTYSLLPHIIPLSTPTHIYYTLLSTPPIYIQNYLLPTPTQIYYLLSLLPLLYTTLYFLLPLIYYTPCFHTYNILTTRYSHTWCVSLLPTPTHTSYSLLHFPHIILLSNSYSHT